MNPANAWLYKSLFFPLGLWAPYFISTQLFLLGYPFYLCTLTFTVPWIAVLYAYPYSIVTQTLDEPSSERFHFTISMSPIFSLLFVNKALNPLTGLAI